MDRLILALSQTRLFWWLRATENQLSFWGRANRFRAQYWLVDEKTNFQALRSQARSTQKPFFFAITFALVCLWLDSCLVQHYPWLKAYITESDSDYITFLGAVSSIGGVFIGLYYTSISAVAGAIYSSVPNNVRELLTYERQGSVYMRYLAFLTFYCLTLVALKLLGFHSIFIAIPLVTLLSGVGIFAFIRLGQQAFHLFDPTALSGPLFNQLRRWLGSVKVGGYRWQDKAFQNHAQKNASDAFDTLDTLSSFTAQKAHLNGKPYIQLCQNLLRFLIQYERAKKFIPTDSFWYQQTYQHKDWYRTEDNRVSIAHRTGTALTPETSLDREWVENRALPIVLSCLQINLDEKRYQETRSLLNFIQAYLVEVSKAGDIERASKLCREISAIVFGNLRANADGTIVKTEQLETLALVEFVASLPITIALEHRTLVSAIDRRKIIDKLLSIDWNKDESIYRVGYQKYFLERLEWLKPRLTFEKKIEGKITSPTWYLFELLSQKECDQLALNTKVLISDSRDFYEDCISKTNQAKRPWITAAILSRELEFWHKIEDQLEMWPDVWSALSSDRKIEGLPWSDFDIDALINSARKRRGEMLKQMSAHALLLTLLERPTGYPDYAGQFLHTSGEATLDALVNNDKEILVSVFALFFQNSLTKFDQLSPKGSATELRVENEFKIASAALLDLMDVSGYAKLLAEFHSNNALWEEVKKSWSAFFGSENQKAKLALFSAVITLNEGGFSIPHRATVRSSWQRKVERLLANIPRHRRFRRGSMGEDVLIKHESALVRVFASEHIGGFYDGIDVFVATYLKALGDSNVVDFGGKGRDLLQSVEHQEEIKADAEAENLEFPKVINHDPLLEPKRGDEE